MAAWVRAQQCFITDLLFELWLRKVEHDWNIKQHKSMAWTLLSMNFKYITRSFGIQQISVECERIDKFVRSSNVIGTVSCHIYIDILLKNDNSCILMMMSALLFLRILKHLTLTLIEIKLLLLHIQQTAHSFCFS